MQFSVFNFNNSNRSATLGLFSWDSYRDSYRLQPTYTFFTKPLGILVSRLYRDKKTMIFVIKGKMMDEVCACEIIEFLVQPISVTNASPLFGFSIIWSKDIVILYILYNFCYYWLIVIIIVCLIISYKQGSLSNASFLTFLF